MGVWNSHTSVGNILGSLIAAYWVSTCWGLSFVVPGVVVAVMGVVCFLFLIERECFPGTQPWRAHIAQAVPKLSFFPEYLVEKSLCAFKELILAESLRLKEPSKVIQSNFA